MAPSNVRHPALPLSLIKQGQSVHFSVLCQRLISDITTLKWCAYSPFTKVKMRNSLRIQIAIDQMNGGDFKHLISLSHSVWSWRLLQRPRESTMASEILQAIPMAAVETGKSHTHATLHFASNNLYYMLMGSIKMFQCLFCVLLFLYILYYRF